MVPVARRSLFAEKGKLAISVAGVSFAVVLMLVVLSLFRGWSNIGGVIEELPADLWVLQQGTTDPLHSVSLLDEREADEIAALDGVQSVTKVFARTMSAQAGGEDTVVYLMALEPPDGREAEAPFFPSSGEVTVDEALADKHGLGVGDTLTVGERELEVSETFSGGNAVMFQFAFVSPEDARELFGFSGAVNYLLVSLAEGADASRLSQRVEGVADGAMTMTGEEFTDGLRREINEGFLPVVGVIVLIGFVVGVAVIGLTTYTATIEKSRDFGVMKAVGANSSYVYRIVISQSLMVGVTGFVLGLAVAVAVAFYAGEVVPEFVTDVRWYDAAGVFLASLVMAVLASYVPVTRVNRIDPATVFRA